VDFCRGLDDRLIPSPSSQASSSLPKGIDPRQWHPPGFLCCFYRRYRRDWLRFLNCEDNVPIVTSTGVGARCHVAAAKVTQKMSRRRLTSTAADCSLAHNKREWSTIRTVQRTVPRFPRCV